MRMLFFCLTKNVNAITSSLVLDSYDLIDESDLDIGLILSSNDVRSMSKSSWKSMKSRELSSEPTDIVEMFSELHLVCELYKEDWSSKVVLKVSDTFLGETKIWEARFSARYGQSSWTEEEGDGWEEVVIRNQHELGSKSRYQSVVSFFLKLVISYLLIVNSC